MITLTEPTPLIKNEAGDILIEGSRVFLEHIVAAYHQGKAPEDMQRDYPDLSLADLYAAVAYYLRHREAVDDYVLKQQQRAKTFAEKAKTYESSSLREKVLEKRQKTR